jgi:integrase
MAIVLNRLTDRAIKAATKPGLLSDGGGLCLQISPTGAKSWVFRWKQAGKIRTAGLGALATTSLAEAREKAKLCRAQREAGQDPIAQREIAKRQAAEGEASMLADLIRSTGPTFGEAADTFIANHTPSLRNAKHAAQWATSLGKVPYDEKRVRMPQEAFRAHVAALAALRALPVAEVSTPAVEAVLRPVWLAVPETANRVRGRIELVLQAAIVMGQHPGPNPARYRDHLRHILPKAKGTSEHYTALPFDQTPGFWQRLRTMRTQSVSAHALAFTIATAARTGETLGATWGEIDEATATWTIPARRMKAGREHRIPLNNAALEILTAMARFGRKPTGHIFPGAKAGKKLSAMSLTMVLRRMDVDATVHGFRSTFRDWAAERTDYAGEVVELALAHTPQSKVEAAYRRGDLFDKRRRLMADWSNYLIPAIP